MSKYKHFRGRIKRAEKWLSQVKQREPDIDSKIAQKEKEISDEEKKFYQEDAR